MTDDERPPTGTPGAPLDPPAAPPTGSTDDRGVPAGDFELPTTERDAPGPAPAAAQGGGPPPPAQAIRVRDPNVEAIARAGLPADIDHWLREVAAQVDPRLDRTAPGWRNQEQSGAARACVFGLMLGRLANDYPHTSGDLGRVAESHASFATLTSGSRLATLREIAEDRSRGAAWIAPLAGLDDPAPLRDLLD